MSNAFSPSRSLSAGPGPKLAQPDLTRTLANVHPQDWHNRTLQTTAEANVSRSESTTQRSASRRLQENQSLALNTTKNRVNLALQQRVAETRRAIAALEDELSQVEGETNELEATKAQLDADLGEKMRAAEVPRACLQRRAQRPPNERVLDTAEMELTAELREFEDAIAGLKQEIVSAEHRLRVLRASRFKILQNLKDKREALDADEQCLQIRESSGM